jgi:hypothetical protein
MIEHNYMALMTQSYVNLMTTQDYVISALIVAIILGLAIANFIRVDRKRLKK